MEPILVTANPVASVTNATYEFDLNAKKQRYTNN